MSSFVSVKWKQIQKYFGGTKGNLTHSCRLKHISGTNSQFESRKEERSFGESSRRSKTFPHRTSDFGTGLDPSFTTHCIDIEINSDRDNFSLVQMAIVIAVQLSVVHETFPKPPAPPPYPAAGQVSYDLIFICVCILI